jgi:hypothetical protein
MKTDKQINIFCICRQLLFLQNTKSCLYNATTNPPNPIQMFFQRREFFEVNYYPSFFSLFLSLSLCLSLSISQTHKHINTQTHKQTHTHFSHFHFILLGMFLLASASSSSSIHFHSSYFSVYLQLALL